METKYFKYKRTYHFPWSLGASSDDKILKSVEHFAQMDEVVVTEKMDGENTTMYNDHYHARSLDSKHHPSRDAVKSLWGVIRHDIPEGWRVCGENLYARHSIAYNALPSFFMVFSIWNEKNEALSWDETVQWCELLGLRHVPVLYRGKWDEKTIRGLWVPNNANATEGYVVRNADSFHYDTFVRNVGKFVRQGHVQTDKHWTIDWVPNKLDA
jgi:hypothetical protein